jgi:hypothetical protein
MFAEGPNISSKARLASFTSFSSHTLPSLGVLVGGDHTTKFIVSRPQLGQMKMEVEVLLSRPISMLQKTRRRQKRRKMSTRKEVKWSTGTTVALRKTFNFDVGKTPEQKIGNYYLSIKCSNPLTL